MATRTHQFKPDYAAPPGWALEERLKVEGLSQAEFARRCGRSPKLISEIISGKAPLEPSTALQIEKVLGVDADYWLGIESNYRLHLAREAEAETAATAKGWLKRFPVKELALRDAIEFPTSDKEALSSLLTFFGVGTIDAWSARYARSNVFHGYSSNFKSSDEALATWLRLGEVAARNQECEEFSEKKLKQAVREIRGLTREPFRKAFTQTTSLCNDAGVALAFVEPLPKVPLLGAARWLTPRKAAIHLSTRHETADHLWFVFFHEVAHILLHSKKVIFVDEEQSGREQIETDADEWASNTLIPFKAWKTCIESVPHTAKGIKEFATEQGIAPGIVVDRLQHSKILPRTQQNNLKVRLKWSIQ